MSALSPGRTSPCSNRCRARPAGALGRRSREPHGPARVVRAPLTAQARGRTLRPEAGRRAAAYRERGRRPRTAAGVPGGIDAGQAVDAARVATLCARRHRRTDPDGRGPADDHREPERGRGRPSRPLPVRRSEGRLVGVQGRRHAQGPAVRQGDRPARLRPPREGHARPRDRPLPGHRTQAGLRGARTSAAPAARGCPNSPTAARSSWISRTATTWSPSTRGASAAPPPSAAGAGRTAGSASLDDDAALADPRTLLPRLKKAAAVCAEHSGPVLPHIGTVDAARDMDVMRRALGDKKLNYLGFSYGSRLGAVYAAQYPDKVGRHGPRRRRHARPSRFPSRASRARGGSRWRWTTSSAGA